MVKPYFCKYCKEEDRENFYDNYKGQCKSCKSKRTSMTDEQKKTMSVYDYKEYKSGIPTSTLSIPIIIPSESKTEENPLKQSIFDLEDKVNDLISTQSLTIEKDIEHNITMNEMQSNIRYLMEQNKKYIALEQNHIRQQIHIRTLAKIQNQLIGENKTLKNDIKSRDSIIEELISAIEALNVNHKNLDIRLNTRIDYTIKETELTLEDFSIQVKELLTKSVTEVNTIKNKLNEQGTIISRIFEEHKYMYDRIDIIHEETKKHLRDIIYRGQKPK